MGMRGGGLDKATRQSGMAERRRRGHVRRRPNRRRFDASVSVGAISRASSRP